MPTSADVDAGTYLELLNKEDGQNESILVRYILGIQSGFVAANAQLSINGRSPLFCQPRNLRLTKDQVLSIFRKRLAELDELEEFADIPIFPAIVLLDAMQTTFPCD